MKLEFTNTEVEQPLNFTLTILGKQGKITNTRIENDGYFNLELSGESEAGNSIVCVGTRIKLYNEKGEFVKEITLKKPIPSLGTG